MIDLYVLHAEAERPVRSEAGAWARAAEDAWLVLAHAGSRLYPGLARSLRTHAAARPDVSIFYADEAFANGDGQQGADRTCKSAFDLTQLWSQDYIGAPVAVRATTARTIGDVDLSKPTAVFELVLHAVGLGRGVARVEEIWAEAPAKLEPSSASDRREILHALPGAPAAGFDLPLGRAPDVLQPMRRFPEAPAVTLLLLGTEALGPAQISRLADDLALVRWSTRNLQVVVEADAADRLRAARRVDGVTIRAAPAGTVLLNAWREASTEPLVFWRADLAPTSPLWLEALMTYALDAGVGAVGARQIDTSARIRHVGLVTASPGVLARPFAGCPATEAGFANWAAAPREWSAVDGGVLACRRAVLEEAGGFDHRVGPELAAPDLCLRLGRLGYRIVSTPAAEFIEPAPPAPANLAQETALFLERWSGYRDVDPHWRGDLADATGPIRPLQQPLASWRRTARIG